VFSVLVVVVLVVVVEETGAGAQRSFGARPVAVRLPKRSLTTCGPGKGRLQRRP
jgi:hypothetical protein